MASRVTITRETPTAAILSNLYNVIRNTLQDNEVYYTEEQVAKLKEDENLIFLERGK